VCARIGHGSFEVTRQHYAQASALHGAQTERVAAILMNQPFAPALPNATKALVRLLAEAPEEVLQELMSLLQSPAEQSIRNPPAALISTDSPTEDC